MVHFFFFFIVLRIIFVAISYSCISKLGNMARNRIIVRENSLVEGYHIQLTPSLFLRRRETWRINNIITVRLKHIKYSQNYLTKIWTLKLNSNYSLKRSETYKTLPWSFYRNSLQKTGQIRKWLVLQYTETDIWELRKQRKENTKKKWVGFKMQDLMTSPLGKNGGGEIDFSIFVWFYDEKRYRCSYAW